MRIELWPDETQLMRRRDIALERIEIGHPVRNVIELSLGEEPLVQSFCGVLVYSSDGLDRFLVILGSSNTRQLAQIVLEEIDDRGAVLLDEFLARGQMIICETPIASFCMKSVRALARNSGSWRTARRR